MQTQSNKSAQEKYERLKSLIKGYGSVLIAFSGGVDSTFLLKVAHDILGENVLAVTALSPTYPSREAKEAKEFADSLGVRHININTDELNIAGFSKNPPDRCYWCKKTLFSELKYIAEKENIRTVCDGSNADDNYDYRPGKKAAKELDIKSPLADTSLSKQDIRELSKQLGLPSWDKPAFACLASRFPFGEQITEKRLHQIEKAEEIVRFYIGQKKQCRVRYHNNIARIEVSPEDFGVIIKFRNEISSQIKSEGFRYIALDIEGYRTGSMNPL